jgi:hypothetical protein
VKRTILGGALAAAVLVPGVATAAPQVNVGVTLGPALTDLRTNGPRVAFHLGARASALFFRERGRDMAIGPYVDFATHAFDMLETGGGIEWLIPVVEDSLPFVLSAGAFARRAPSLPWEPGIATTLFFGSRSYNFHSVYGLAAGVFLQGRYGLGDGKQADVILGLQIDLAALAMPFIYLFNAVAR